MRISEPMFSALQAASIGEYQYCYPNGGAAYPGCHVSIRQTTIYALEKRGLVKWDSSVGPARLVLTSMGRTVYEKEKTK